MNYRRQPFQFTAIDPAKRHAELQKRFGLPSNEMYVDGINPDLMGGYRETSSVGNSPRIQRRIPVFNSSNQPEKPDQANNFGHKPRVRVIPIQVEGVDAPLKRHRTFSGPAGSAKEDDPKSQCIKSHIPTELPGIHNTNETVKRPSLAKVCNIPVQIEPRMERTSVKPKVEKKIEVKRVPNSASIPETDHSKITKTNGCVASKVEETDAEPDLSVPLKQIDAVLNKLKTYSEEVENFTGTPKDKQYRYLDEMLTRCMLDLDDVETHGIENIRQSRKAAIRKVQACIDLLDTKINVQTSTSEDASMVDLTANSVKVESNAEPVIEVNEEKLTTPVLDGNSALIIEEVQDDLSNPIVEVTGNLGYVEQEVDLEAFEEVDNAQINSAAVEVSDKTESVLEMTVDHSDETVPIVLEADDSVASESVPNSKILESGHNETRDLNSQGDVEMGDNPVQANSPATIQEVEEMEISDIVPSEQKAKIPTETESPFIVEPSDFLDSKQTCDSYGQVEEPNSADCSNVSAEYFPVEELTNDSVSNHTIDQFVVEELSNDSLNSANIGQFSIEELSNDSVNNQLIEKLPTVIET